jgi:hypothetical protein
MTSPLWVHVLIIALALFIFGEILRPAVKNYDKDEWGLPFFGFIALLCIVGLGAIMYWDFRTVVESLGRARYLATTFIGIFIGVVLFLGCEALTQYFHNRSSVMYGNTNP